MKHQFKLHDISSSLGVAPATAERIAGLLNGTINPDNFKSVLDDDPLGAFFGTIIQHDKVMLCVAYLLNADLIEGLCPYIDRDVDDDVPTVILHEGEFIISSYSDFVARFEKGKSSAM